MHMLYRFPLELALPIQEVPVSGVAFLNLLASDMFTIQLMYSDSVLHHCHIEFLLPNDSSVDLLQI